MDGWSGILKQTRLLTIVLALVMVIAFVYLLSDYSRLQKKQTDYTSQIESAKHALALLGSPGSGFEQQLASAQAANTVALQHLADHHLNSTNLINSVLDCAAQNGLQVNSLTSEQWIRKAINGTDYKNLPIELNLTGSLNQFIDFTRNITNVEKFPNLLVTNTVISVGSRSSAGNTIVSVELSLILAIRQIPSPIGGSN
jgi:Tfp pilus assembly protein PilO